MLEHAVLSWAQWTLEDREMLENVQCRAAVMLSCCLSWIPGLCSTLTTEGAWPITRSAKMWGISDLIGPNSISRGFSFYQMVAKRWKSLPDRGGDCMMTKSACINDAVMQLKIILDVWYIYIHWDGFFFPAGTFVKTQKFITGLFCF